MPIIEHDPWRDQYFENVACPADVIISTDDTDSYRLYPKHNWIYNKLRICETQGFEHAPHGIMPKSFPVFSKPIYNLRGMGADSRVIENAADYRQLQQAGHMWMPVLTGEHVSTDAAVVDGEAKWWRHVIGHGLGEGVFDYWHVLAESRPAVEEYCAAWLRANLRGYTGMVNFETIGAKIIEAHLRFSDQWPDLYGKGWLDALVKMHTHGQWDYDNADLRDGYSVVLFGAHGIRYRHPDPALVQDILAQPEVTSVQITFHADRSPKSHSMPPGGFRLAIINCWDLDVGRRAREQLALSFWSAQKVLTRKPKRAATA